jgi:hypothetical protein
MRNASSDSVSRAVRLQRWPIAAYVWVAKYGSRTVTKLRAGDGTVLGSFVLSSFRNFLIRAGTCLNS